DVGARNEFELLEDGGDAGRLRGARVSEPHFCAVDQHLAGVRLHHARENVHQRRLPGPVLAEQRMDLAAIEIEVDPAERLDPTEAFDDPAHGEQWRGRDQRRLARKRSDGRATRRYAASASGLVRSPVGRSPLLRDDAPSGTAFVRAPSALAVTSSPTVSGAPQSP